MPHSPRPVAHLLRSSLCFCAPRFLVSKWSVKSSFLYWFCILLSHFVYSFALRYVTVYACVCACVCVWGPSIYTCTHVVHVRDQYMQLSLVYSSATGIFDGILPRPASPRPRLWCHPSHSSFSSSARCPLRLRAIWDFDMTTQISVMGPRGTHHRESTHTHTQMGVGDLRRLATSAYIFQMIRRI